MSYIVLPILLLIAFSACRTFKWQKSPFAGSPQIFINSAVCKCSNCSSVGSVSASQAAVLRSTLLSWKQFSVFCRFKKGKLSLSSERMGT